MAVPRRRPAFARRSGLGGALAAAVVLWMI